MSRYAIFFPQYYSIEVNDLAWGRGFTDWSLIASANAFNYWPRRAPQCGFYNLSRDEDIRARFESAASAGLDGFGIYHYRFDDGPELDAVERYLQRHSPPAGFSYFYIWANENWSTRWVGENVRLLKELSAAPDRHMVAAHVEYLGTFMRTSSYTKVGDRPLLVFYRPDHFSDSKASLALYREEFNRIDLNPLIGYFVKNVSDMQYSKDFDYSYLFEPRLFFNFHGLRKNPLTTWTYHRLARLISWQALETISEMVTRVLNKQSGSHNFAKFLSYLESSARRKFIDSSDCPVQEVVTCGWNNAPRYLKRYTKLDVPTVEQFSRMMRAITNSPQRSSQVPLLCNAWNEWSEGAAIEPCFYLGDRLLKSYLSEL